LPIKYDAGLKHHRQQQQQQQRQQQQGNISTAKECDENEALNHVKLEALGQLKPPSRFLFYSLSITVLPRGE